MLDHESLEEVKEDWISKLFKLSERPCPPSPGSSRGTPKTKGTKNGKSKNKSKKTNKATTKTRKGAPWINIAW